MFFRRLFVYHHMLTTSRKITERISRPVARNYPQGRGGAYARYWPRFIVITILDIIYLINNIII